MIPKESQKTGEIPGRNLLRQQVTKMNYFGAQESQLENKHRPEEDLKARQTFDLFFFTHLLTDPTRD